jgi:hypothetical protein
VAESFLIMHYSKGGVSKLQLDIMPLDEFKLYLWESLRIQDLQSNDKEGD